MSGPAGPAPGAGQAWAAQRRRRAQLVDELDQDLQLLDVLATAALRAGLVVDLHVWASWSSTRCWPGPGGAAGRDHA
ncbi:hypothetical protein [Delftia sp. GW456-R20]|uniref:hypothetical protein n=1 Tax=Delftia sp. GW456-R20 TaxID=1827145 RepID=UPI000A5C3E47|nr:hypothetical protein [Delftia sp. GW456-R20]